jgi:cobalamin biosynthesis Co2+ chelatase CbiK
VQRIEEAHKKSQEEWLPRIVNALDFLDEQIPDSKVLISGMLNQGCQMMLAGGSKTFKTWMLLDLAMSIAAGVPWLGFDTAQARVLYVDFELRPKTLQRRILKIKSARNLTWEKPMLEIMPLRGKAASYDELIPKILEAVKNKGYGAIILDPIYKIYGNTDENKAGDVARVLNELERLSVESGAAVIFSHHYSKGNQSSKDPIDRASGSGVYGRHGDCMLSVTRHEVENAYVIESTLREFKPLDPIVVKWEDPVMVRDISLNPRKLKTPISKTPTFTAKDLMAAIATESMTCTEWKNSVMKNTGMSTTTFNRLLQSVKETPGVILNQTTKKYTYQNPEGATLKKVPQVPSSPMRVSPTI